MKKMMDIGDETDEFKLATSCHSLHFPLNLCFFDVREKIDHRSLKSSGA